MQDLMLTPATIVIIILLLLGIVLAVRRLLHKGPCDCNDTCDSCAGCSMSGQCKGADVEKECPAAKNMVDNIEKDLASRKDA